jgi:hypothetical protein
MISLITDFKPKRPIYRDDTCNQFLGKDLMVNETLIDALPTTVTQTDYVFDTGT